ncbi:MAG TPA: condensation domain-containing protein, partial [Ruminiclostridium sp.]|nr:condensation domain-containing protein [Ruminiclostridium sp.]
MHTDENDLNQSTAEFLSELKSKNIKLWVEDGLLRFRAPKGVLNEEIKSRLKDRKENIIDYFERKNAEKIFSSPIEPVEEQEYYPLSAAQRRMFVLNQMDRDSTAYNLTQVYKIEGAFDKERLSAVIGQLIDRHESLRTSYFLKDGKPVQKIHRKIDFNLEYKENDADQEQIDKEIYNFIRPYDLSKPPLFRMKLIKMTGTDTYYLLYDMHHIISDGISVAIMVDEINKLYSNITLPDLKIQYKDYAVILCGINSDVILSQFF